MFEIKDKHIKANKVKELYELPISEELLVTKSEEEKKRDQLIDIKIQIAKLKENTNLK
jgi:hypothetical protein